MSFRTKEFILPSAFLFLLAFGITFPALKLPWSIIDDPWYLTKWRESLDLMKQGEFTQGLHVILPPGENRFGLPVVASVLLQRVVFDCVAPLWHFFKSAMFFFALLGLFCLGRISGFTTRASLLGAFLFAMFNPWSIYQDMQAFIGNWYRLFNNDTYVILFTIWQAFFFIAFLKKESLSIPHLIGFFVFATLAYNAKINALHTLPAFMATLIVYAIMKKKLERRVVILAAALLAAWLTAFFRFAPYKGTAIVGYASPYNLTPAAYWGALIYYRDLMLDALGLLPIVGLSAFAVLFFAKRTDAISRLGLLLAFFLFLFGYLTQSFWAHLLPRYMVIFVPYLCALCGWTLDSILFTAPIRLFKDKRALNLLSSYAIGFALWIAALAPILFSQVPTLKRQVAFVGLLGIAAVLLAAHYIGTFMPSLRALSRRGLFLILPILVFQGNFLHQTLLSALSITDFAKNYRAFSANNWSWMRFTAERAKREAKPEARVMIAPGDPEWVGHFEYAAKRIFSAPSIRTRAFEEKDAQNCDYIVSAVNRNHPTSDAFVPTVWNGYVLKKIEPSSKANVVFYVLSGSWLSFTVRLPQDVMLAGIQFLGNTSKWHHKVDLQISVRTGEQEIEGTLTGEQVARLIAPPPPFLFERPLMVRAGEDLKVRLDCRRHGPTQEGTRLGTVVLLGQQGRTTRALFNGKPSTIAPSFRLYVAYPLPHGFEKVFDTSYTTQSFITMSPYAIWQVIRGGREESWYRDFFRPISYTYAVQVYENRHPSEK